MAHNWNYDRAADHIDKKLADVKTVEVVDYKRDTANARKHPNQQGLSPRRRTHCYADILNLDDMLGVTDVEGTLCHKQHASVSQPPLPGGGADYGRAATCSGSIFTISVCMGS